MSTQGRYLHTMLRVGDLDRSIKFYKDMFGMKELRRRDVALVGPPLRLPWLGLWTLLGCGSMIAVILLAQWDEIGGLVAAVVGSCLLYRLARGARAAS